MKVNRLITRFSEKQKSKTEDVLAEEVFYKLSLNGEYLTGFYCSPDYLNELATGYLYTRGFISSQKDISIINTGETEIEVYSKDFSNSKQGQPQEKPTLSYREISVIMKDLDSRGIIFRETGGTHIAGLYSDQQFIFTVEDVSRHNAILKTLGFGLRQSIDYSQAALFLSCRITASIIDLVSRTSLQLVCSQSAATNLALEKASQSDISIIGFIRDERMNLYTDSQEFI